MICSVQYVKNFMKRYHMKDYQEIAEKIRQSDAILIGASNGFSISEGLHIFADNEKFDRIFGDFKRMYGIRCILDGFFIRWNTENVRWAFLSRLINHYSIGYNGSPNMRVLKTLIGDKPYFFVTSNGECHFELAGFDEKRVWEIEGNWNEIQCGYGCHDTIYPLFPLIPSMTEAEKDMKIPNELIPKCPKCGRNMIPHSPQRNPVAADSEKKKRYQDFITQFHNKKLIILELGIGWKNQLIKAPLMKLAENEPLATYVIVNKGEVFIPNTIENKSFGLDGDMTEILMKLEQAYKA